MKTPPRRSSDRVSSTSGIPNQTTSKSAAVENDEEDQDRFSSFSGSEVSFDPGKLDSLSFSDEPVSVFPPIESEIRSGDSFAEILNELAVQPEDSKPYFSHPSSEFFSRRAISFLTSILIHLVILVGLAILVMNVKSGSQGEPLRAGFSEEEELVLDDAGEDIDALDLDFSEPVLSDIEPEFLQNDTKSTELSAGQAAEAESVTVQSLEQIGSEADGAGLLEKVTTAKATSGRNAATRKHGLPGREGDTTDESEAAVEAGLAWLAHHQLPDGSWSFDLTATDDNGRFGECQGSCSNSHGTSGAVNLRNNLYPSRMAATGIALLAYLGAGYDHQTPGLYRKTVEDGINYLRYHVRPTKSGADCREEGERYGLYTQAIVALTLCEAYELTDDQEMKVLAWESTRFIAESQRDDGGWRYQAVSDPDFFSYSPSDTSVSGWQMLALKSGMSAGFEYPPELFYKVGYFLDTVQVDQNTSYQYMANKSRSTEMIWGTTAVGILMREYLGWGPDKKEMKGGIDRLLTHFKLMNSNWKLAKRGALEDKRGIEIIREGRFVYNLYFAYYATIALHHFGGKDWHKTFAKTRDFLIETQNQGDVNPHEEGSWLFYDRYLNDGGRLLQTALAVLILETPYRYLPMYK